jgi:hypothetical protein
MVVFMDFNSRGPGSKPSQGASGKAGELQPEPSDYIVEVVSSQKGSK